MSDKKKKILFSVILLCALGILITIGYTFAYFQTSIGSEENAINTRAAEYKIGLSEDVSLIKDKIIPSEERFIDIASTRRDIDGNFLKPYEDGEGQLITADTVCIDDNLKEICSIYSFTVINDMDTDVPLYFTLNQKVNTFENLYLKIIDEDNNVVMGATHIIDDRYEVDNLGNYLKDSDDNLIKKANFDDLEVSPISLTGINNTILPGTTDSDNPSTVTYSIVMWIMETGIDQTKEDSGKLFASTLTVNAGSADGLGITGVFSAYGTE